MKINKRYLRNIRENLSFYISSTVLTVIALLLFLLFNIAGTGINDFADEFFAKHNIEDANFTTYIEIPDEEIETLEEEYSLTLEKQLIINVEEDTYTARVFSYNTKIDTYEITVGEDVASDDEVIISEGYAEYNNISVGDFITLSGKDYRICGFFQRPDYLYMLKETDDTYKNVTSFFLAYVSASEFERLGTPNVTYLAAYDGNDTIIKDFRRYINEQYVISEYISSDMNERILMVHSQADLFVMMSYILLVVVPLVTVALISIILSRKVKSEQKMIGTLSAMGYKKGTLMVHYSLLAVIPGIIGGILCVIIVSLAAQGFGEMGLADYEPMHIEFKMSLIAGVMSVVIPTLMYLIAALLTVRKLLKKDTVVLLNGNAGKDKSSHRLLVGAKGSVRTKFAFRTLVNNGGRSFVVALGIFLGTFIILIGNMMVDSIEEIGDTGMDSLGDYQYQYILNSLETDAPEAGEPVLTASLEYDGSTFTIMGVDSDCELFNLTTEDGERADIDSGYYISEFCSLVYGIEAGDTLKFNSITTMEEYSVTIEGIIDNTVSKNLISSRENIAGLLGLDELCYNSVISEEQLVFSENKVATTVTKSDIKDQMGTIMDEMGLMINTLTILGAIICIAAIYVAVNMLISENRSNISMLKVLGLRDKEINKMVLNANHILLPIGYLVAIPIVYFSCKYYFLWVAKEYEILFPVIISLSSLVITAIIVCICYFGSLFVIRNKVSKVDMVLSLKDNRE